VFYPIISQKSEIHPFLKPGYAFTTDDFLPASGDLLRHYYTVFEQKKGNVIRSQNLLFGFQFALGLA
jgi:hypothetical protein